MKHLILVLLFTFSQAVIAQGKIGVTAKVDFVSPVGIFYDTYGRTIGYSFMLHYRIDSSSELTANFGFYRWKREKFYLSKEELVWKNVYTDLSLPLLGFRYYVRVGEFRPYFCAEFGLHFIREEFSSFWRGEMQDYLSFLTLGFGSGVGIGILFAEELDYLYFDFHLKYNTFFDERVGYPVNSFSISVGVRVSFKK